MIKDCFVLMTNDYPQFVCATRSKIKKRLVSYCKKYVKDNKWKQPNVVYSQNGEGAVIQFPPGKCENWIYITVRQIKTDI